MSEEKTWLNEIIEAFQELGGCAHYSELYEYIEKNTSRTLPTSWKAIVRGVTETYSSDSEAFAGTKDIFYSVDGIGSGYWGLRNFIDAKTPKACDIDDSIDKKYPGKSKVETYRKIRDTSLTRSLKLLYNHKCQICGKILNIGYYNYSEAHHIRPLGNGHKGTDSMDNIIVLCPNHHVEFDYGSIAIDPSTYKIIHIDESYEFVGDKISKKHELKKENLQYHLDNIYMSY